jgi:3-oxoacyl-[acyl-carrier protein] reductase
MSAEAERNGFGSGGSLPRRGAVVTGGSRGLGEAIVRRLACSGCDVLFTYSGQADQTAATTPAPGGGRVIAVRADVRDAAAAREVIQTASREFGGLHVLVNNAGITRDRALTSMSESDWSDVLDINLGGAFLYSQAAAKVFMRQMSGRIINITSISGLRGVPGQTNYSASKAGMVGLTKSMARELGPFNVTVNAVAPGYIETRMLSHLTPQFRSRMTKQTPMGRFGCSEDVSRLVEYLASDVAGYVTGQVIGVDGGLGI